MKFVIEYPKSKMMRLFIQFSVIFSIISCGVMNHTGKGQAVLSNTAILTPVPIIPLYGIRHDTTTFIKTKPVEQDLDLRTETHNVIEKTNDQDNVDSLKGLLYDMARVQNRILDRAHENRVEKDSALIVAKQIRDTVNAQKAATHSAKSEHLQLSVTYGMFDYIIGFCLVICTLAAIKTLLPHHWFKKKYTV